MKFTGNQRKLYLLALAMLVVAIALACTWNLWERPAERTATPTALPTQSPAPVGTDNAQTTPAPTGSASASENVSGTDRAPDTANTPAVSASPEASLSSAADAQQTSASAVQGAKTVDTVVYYQDNYGYLVPVMCKIPAEEGIAKATLSMMVQSTANDMQAARLGLRTVIPENVEIDLDIAKGVARIDLSEEALALADAAAEANMVAAVVQTLTEFPTVEKVEFLIDGQKRAQLPHGTNISGTFTRTGVNLEMAAGAMSLQDAKPVTLYFPGDASNVLVPVTRLVYSQPDIETAVLELTKGPSSSGTLESVLPAGCGLIGVSVENGVAKINFTRELISLAENTDGGRLAIKALVLTCTQFDGIDKVEILVEGEPYDTGVETLAVPTCANVAQDLVDSYIQTQSALLFDFE